MDRINVYLTGWKLHFKLVFTSPPMIINYFWQKEAFSLKKEVLKTLARGCHFTMNGTAEKVDTSTVFEHPNPFQNEQSMKSVMEGDVIKGLTFKKWMTTVVLWFVRLVKIPKHWKLIFEIFHTFSWHSNYSDVRHDFSYWCHHELPSIWPWKKSISVFWGWVKFLSRLFIRVEYFDHQNGFDSL